MSGAGTGDTMVLPGWIGNQGDVVEGGRSAEALVWEQWPLFGRCGFGHHGFVDYFVVG